MNHETPWVTAAAGGLANIEDFWRRMTSILYYILRPVLTDNPGDEAEADHGDDPGGQQTLHGGVWRPRGVTMSQSCHDKVTAAACSVTESRPAGPADQTVLIMPGAWAGRVPGANSALHSGTLGGHFTISDY